MRRNVESGYTLDEQMKGEHHYVNIHANKNGCINIAQMSLDNTIIYCSLRRPKCHPLSRHHSSILYHHSTLYRRLDAAPKALLGDAVISRFGSITTPNLLRRLDSSAP